jgi:hypothetical protein
MGSSTRLLKLRPFERRLKPHNASREIQCRGEVEGTHYILTIGSARYPIGVADVGHDEIGDFVEVWPARHPVGGGLELVVEEEFTEPPPTIPPGCYIAVVQPADPEVVDSVLEAHGYERATVNVLAPNRSSISFSFSPDGACNGWGSNMPADLDPQ